MSLLFPKIWKCVLQSKGKAERRCRIERDVDEVRKVKDRSSGPSAQAELVLLRDVEGVRKLGMALVRRHRINRKGTYTVER